MPLFGVAGVTVIVVPDFALEMEGACCFLFFLSLLLLSPVLERSSRPTLFERRVLRRQNQERRPPAALSLLAVLMTVAIAKSFRRIEHFTKLVR